jgi:hypothetical protein
MRGHVLVLHGNIRRSGGRAWRRVLGSFFPAGRIARGRLDVETAHQHVLITWPTGVGKAYLAGALAQQACRHGYRVPYRRLPRSWPPVTSSDLTARHRPGHSERSRIPTRLLSRWTGTQEDSGRREETLPASNPRPRQDPPTLGRSTGTRPCETGQTSRSAKGPSSFATTKDVASRSKMSAGEAVVTLLASESVYSS